jgi:hypothetical protein
LDSDIPLNRGFPRNMQSTLAAAESDFALITPYPQGINNKVLGS